MTSFQNKKVAVLGLARAGVPAAKFLVERGAQVIGFDDKNLDELSDQARALSTHGIELRAGNHEYSGLDKCELVVLSPGLRIHHSPLKETLARLENKGVEVIGELELAYRFCPAPIIAVTGTKGKSTTTKLIAEMLIACGIDAVRAGNTGIPLIAELPNLSKDSWAVVEVSSFQLERAPTFRPRVGVLLNLLEDHQDYHTSLEQYWETKLKLFANQGEGDTAIFNCDDGHVEDFAISSGFSVNDGTNFHVWKHTNALRILTSGQELSMFDAQESDVFGHDGFLGWITNENFEPVIEMSKVPLLGKHNHSNVAAALAAVWRVLGLEKATINIEKIANAIRNFQSLPHRLEIVARKDGITWVNDSQATIPDAAVAALEAFPSPRVLIAGGRAKLDERAYAKLGEAIFKNAEALLVIGEASEMIALVAENAGFSKAKIVSASNLTNAVKTAKMWLPSGGSVLLSPACASFDQFTSFEARGEAFRAAVAAL